MALPSIRGSAALTNGTIASATPVVNLPATVVAGDTLFVVFRSAVAGAIGFPAGWTELFDASPDGADDQLTAAWRLATGTEGGTTITLSATSGKFAAVAWCIRDAADPTVTAPAISTVATGVSPNEPNATTVTPTGGSADYLYLTFFGMEGEQTGITTYPASYTLGQSGLANSGTGGAVTTNVTVAGAARQKGLTTAGSASEDAGAWDVAGTLDDWSAYTVAFYPEPVPVGALSLVGLAAVALVALAISVPAGAVALTGLAPTVVRDIAIEIPAGQINIKGPQSPNSVAVAVPVGSLTVTGQYVRVQFSPLGVGSLAWTGYAIVNPFALPAGQAVFAGLTPTVSISDSNTTISNAAAVLAITGLAPTARLGDLILEPGAGQLVIKGPQRPQVVTAIPVGAISFTSTATGVAVDTPGSGLGIPAGSLVLTGQTPLRVVDRPIAVPVGALTLTGQYVGIQFMQPASGSLAWQGHALSFGAPSITIALPRGLLAWGQTALIPQVLFGITLAVPAGQVVLAGQEPNTATFGTIVVPNGVLSLAGQAPTIDWSTALHVGAVTFTGGTLVASEVTGESGFQVGQVVWQGYAPQPMHSNNAVVGSTVSIVRSLANGVVITRTLRSEVRR